MGKAGYAILFIFLFFLMAVHPGFIWLFFIAIIAVIVSKTRKRRKPKVSVYRRYAQDYQKQKDNSEKVHGAVPKVDHDYLGSNSEDHEKLVKKKADEERENIWTPEELRKFTGKSSIQPTNTSYDPQTGAFGHVPSKINEEIHKTQEDISKYFKNHPNHAPNTVTFGDSNETRESHNSSFNRNYWDFRNYDTLGMKKSKFVRAVEFCETNNLGSKAKLRRLRMKLDKWSIENERDLEAILPDFEYLLKLMEEFENN